jgi:oxygen-independent coproporphyrinogen-3 oxidase
MLLYIHIPFCDSKCHYCSFNSYVDKFELKEQYIDALIEQFEYEKKRFNIQKKSIETLYIGGGTPSCVDVKEYQKLLHVIAPYLKDNIQKSIEANPNSATKQWLLGIKELGFNRISFGVQSFDDSKLKLLGRSHKSKDAINAIKDANDIGFEHISLDLIYSTSMDSKELLLHDLDIAFSLPIDHISTYSLTLEEGTLFENNESVKNDNLSLNLFLYDEIKKRGFEHYEISNFGNRPSKHNLGYWEYKDYIGLGSGAVGFLKDRRFYPHKDIQSYIDNSIYCDEEILSNEDIYLEKIFLGLRCMVGVDRDLLHVEHQKRADTLVDEGKLTCKDSVYFNSDFLLADEIALFITS